MNQTDKTLKVGQVSFTRHELFPALRKHMYAQFTGVGRNVRICIARKKLPPHLRRQLSSAIQPCVSCGTLMHPIRNGRYYAATCPLQVNIGCSRTGNASHEYDLLREALNPSERQ